MRRPATRHPETAIEVTRLDCHINDQEFADKALEVFDGWVASGVIDA